jgi:hypothetical protein
VVAARLLESPLEIVEEASCAYSPWYLILSEDLDLNHSGRLKSPNATEMKPTSIHQYRPPRHLDSVGTGFLVGDPACVETHHPVRFSEHWTASAVSMLAVASESVPTTCARLLLMST